ncbi:MAG: M3 family metallopeptidase, partial [Lentisphaeria bacterium]
EKVMERVVSLSLKLSQSKEIYDGLVAIRDGEVWNQLNSAQQRAVELRIRSSFRSGISLEGEKKGRFNEIETRISKLTTDYNNNVLDSTKAFELIITDKKDTEGWTTTLLNMASESFNQAKKSSESSPENGPWRITLDFPSYGPFMQHSRNSEQRKMVLIAASSKASSGEFDNSKILLELLQLRKEKAQLLGYTNFAEMSLDVKMAKELSAVNEMRDELYNACYLPAQNEMEALKEFAEENGVIAFNHWDVAFWSERQREKLFNYTDEELRPYFPLPKVLDGLFTLSKKLFGITIVESTFEAPTWHSDVSFYNVYNEQNIKVASFYLDPYSRPLEKNGGAWMNTLFNKSSNFGEAQLPVVYLVCNGTPASKDKPSLMSFYEVLTLFHEFGHGLQAMLTTVEVNDLAGIGGIDWDAVELASQFMENWCYHKETLIGLTSHYITGEKLPDCLFEKIYASKNYQAAMGMLRQINLGWLDMALYSEFDPYGSKNPLELQMEIAKKCATMPPLQESRLINSFTHIFCGGYGAGYYSYKWSEVLSADAFSAFEEAGLENENEIMKLGRKYRDTILALGGSKPPMDVFVQFRGRKPSTKPLLKHNGLI